MPCRRRRSSALEHGTSRRRASTGCRRLACRRCRAYQPGPPVCRSCKQPRPALGLSVIEVARGKGGGGSPNLGPDLEGVAGRLPRLGMGDWGRRAFPRARGVRGGAWRSFRGPVADGVGPLRQAGRTTAGAGPPEPLGLRDKRLEAKSHRRCIDGGAAGGVVPLGAVRLNHRSDLGVGKEGVALRPST